MNRFWRMIPGVALAAAVTLLIVGILIAVYSERAYKAQKIGEMTVQAQILASSVTAALAFNDDDAAGESVSAQQANPDVMIAAIYDAKGAPFAVFSRLPEENIPTIVHPMAPNFQGDMLVVAVPVLQNGALLGTAFLQAVTEPMAQRFIRYSAIGLLVARAAILIGVLGAAQGAVSRSNRELAEANQALRAQIEERARVEEALRQSQKMEAIGQLSGGIAHDFNNLLTIIQGNIHRMKRRLAQGDTDVARFIDFALEGVARATSVTQRVLAFSRRQPLSPKPVDLNRLVHDLEPLLQHSLGALAKLETRLEARWWTLCDVNQMENAILNLVINARDAMPDGGTCTITTEDVTVADEPQSADDLAPGQYVKIVVGDSGVGMSDTVRAKAIDPFFTTKPSGQGTGLGLSMVFGFIKQSKGTLQIDSGVGEGTRIVILLPRHGTSLTAPVDDAPAVPQTVGSPASAADQKRAKKMPTVFIVEDEALVRDLAVQAVKGEGFQVIEEGDGSAALMLLQSNVQFDVLITDVKLPGVNGFVLAEETMTRRPGIPVLIVTGFTGDPVPENLTRSGVKVLYKPYDLDELVDWARRMTATGTGALAG